MNKKSKTGPNRRPGPDPEKWLSTFQKNLKRIERPLRKMTDSSTADDWEPRAKEEIKKPSMVSKLPEEEE